MSRVFDVEIVDTIAKANERVNEARFDTVVVEDKLPDGSGRSFLSTVRTLDSNCRRVLIAEADVPTEREVNPSYEQFLQKPVNVYTLMAHVERLTRRSDYQGTIQGTA
jgi:DNA-binding response OmpR family regulator